MARAIHRGDVWAARLDPTAGSEQAGTRPVVIVSNDPFNEVMPIVTVVPVTSHRGGRRVYPSEAHLAKGIGGLRGDSLAMCHQIRTIARARLGRYLGTLDSPAVVALDRALATHLGIPTPIST